MEANVIVSCQNFCSNLEKLIQWLHKVVERMDILSPPSVDIESVKASLADYKVSTTNIYIRYLNVYIV